MYEDTRPPNSDLDLQHLHLENLHRPLLSFSQCHNIQTTHHYRPYNSHKTFPFTQTSYYHNSLTPLYTNHSILSVLSFSRLHHTPLLCTLNTKYFITSRPPHITFLPPMCTASLTPKQSAILHNLLQYRPNVWTLTFYLMDVLELILNVLSYGTISGKWRINIWSWSSTIEYPPEFGYIMYSYAFIYFDIR